MADSCVPGPFEAEVLEVIPPNSTWAVVRYRGPGRKTGTVRVFLEDYDVRYWPPAKGDILRIQLQSVEILRRPRGAKS